MEVTISAYCRLSTEQLYRSLCRCALLFNISPPLPLLSRRRVAATGSRSREVLRTTSVVGRGYKLRTTKADNRFHCDCYIPASDRRRMSVSTATAVLRRNSSRRLNG